jgi:hypothetical protein
MYRRHLAGAVGSFDVLPLARFLDHFARWHVEAPRPPEVERVVDAVLDAGAAGLGIGAGR